MVVKEEDKEKEVIDNKLKLLNDFQRYGMLSLKSVALGKDFNLDNPRNIEMLMTTEQQITEARNLLSEFEIADEYLDKFMKEAMEVLKDWVSLGMTSYTLIPKIIYLIDFYKDMIDSGW